MKRTFDQALAADPSFDFPPPDLLPDLHPDAVTFPETTYFDGFHLDVPDLQFTAYQDDAFNLQQSEYVGDCQFPAQDQTSWVGPYEWPTAHDSVLSHSGPSSSIPGSTSLEGGGEDSVSFGMIPRIKCRALVRDVNLREELEACNADNTCVPLQLQPSRGGFIIGFENLPEMLLVNSKHTLALRELCKISEVRTQPFVSKEDLEKLFADTIEEGKNRFLMVNVSIYGPDRISEQVGSVLSRNGVFLQDPPPQQLTYNNPHMLLFEDIMDFNTWIQDYIVGIGDMGARTKGAVSMSTVLDDLADHQTNHASLVAPDASRVKTPLLL
jgi:hypothetical protein